MKRWYSARGARRGVKWSVFAAVCWLCWAVGYWQAMQPHVARPISLARTAHAHLHASGH